MKLRQTKLSWKIGLRLLILAGILSLTTLNPIPFIPTQAAPTSSFTFTVESTQDVGDLNPGDGLCDASPDPGYQCTLRAAIMEANAMVGAQSIYVNPGNYVLSGSSDEDEAATGDLDLSEEVTIFGADADTTIIDGNRVDRIFQIHLNVSASLQNLTLRNGQPEDDAHGGAILNIGGTLTLDDSKVLTSTAKWGGGIAVIGNLSTATIKNSQIHDNQAGRGGGIYNQGILTLEYSEISANRISSTSGFGTGAGIANSGDLTIKNSTISNNLNPEANGGGILNASTGDLLMVDSTVSGNTAGKSGGGIYFNTGEMYVYGCTINGNSAGEDGGGLHITNSDGQLINCTVSGNFAKKKRCRAVFRQPI